MVALFEVHFRRKHGKDITIACKKNMKKNLREWREFGACKVCLTGREINLKRVTRTGKKMARVHIINTQRNDWFWNMDTSFRDYGSKFRETLRATERASLLYHYSVLGLDRRRTTPYTDEEIKGIRNEGMALTKKLGKTHEYSRYHQIKFEGCVICMPFATVLAYLLES